LMIHLKTLFILGQCKRFTEFLQVLDAQILLLEDHLKVAFKIMNRARCFLARAAIRK
jgi:hypothetical protein